MFCTKCGKELENGAAFCSHCGSAVENAQTAQTDFFQDDFAQPQYEMQYQQAQPQQEESNGMAIAGFVCSFLARCWAGFSAASVCPDRRKSTARARGCLLRRSR